MPAVLVTGPAVTQNSPFLFQQWPWPSPVLIAPTRQHLSYDVCLEVREDYQNCSVLYCVLKLYTVVSTLRRLEDEQFLQFSGLGFVTLGHISLCVDLYVFICGTSSTARWLQASCSCVQGVTWPASTVRGRRLSALDRHRPPITAIGWCLDMCNRKNTNASRRQEFFRRWTVSLELSACRITWQRYLTCTETFEDTVVCVGLWRIVTVAFSRRVQIFLLTHYK